MDAFAALTGTGRSRRRAAMPPAAFRASLAKVTAPVAQKVEPQPPAMVVEPAAAVAPESIAASEPEHHSRWRTPQTQSVQAEAVAVERVEANDACENIEEMPLPAKTDEVTGKGESKEEAIVEASVGETTSTDDEKVSNSISSEHEEQVQLPEEKHEEVAESISTTPLPSESVVVEASPEKVEVSQPVRYEPVVRVCRNCPGPKVPHHCVKSATNSFFDQLKALQTKRRNAPQRLTR